MYAFWGCIDDYVESSACRNIMKTGRYIERLDLYIRLDYDKKAMELAYERMAYRLQRSRAAYNEDNFRIVSDAINDKKGGNLSFILPNLNNIFKD